MRTTTDGGGLEDDDYEVVALLSPSAAASLDVVASPLAGAVQEAGAHLEVVGAAPGPTGEDRYYRALLGDRQVAEELARRMRAIDGVEAAYVKPGGELPA